MKASGLVKWNPPSIFVREVPDREDMGRMLEEAMGFISFVKAMGLSTKQHLIATELLTRYEAAKKGGS